MKHGVLSLIVFDFVLLAMLTHTLYRIQLASISFAESGFQVHREEGLELHLEMVSRQRGQARAGTKTAAMQEDLAALGAKLSSTSARLVIAENTKTKLEQELASEK